MDSPGRSLGTNDCRGSLRRRLDRRMAGMKDLRISDQSFGNSLIRILRNLTVPWSP